MIISIGYLASICLAFALMVKNTIKARWFNVAGNVFFIVYGILVPAIPVIIANTGLLFINIFQLYKLYNKQEQFKLIEITHENNLGKYFLQHYDEDIKQFFPKFNWQHHNYNLSFVVLRNMELANIFVAHLDEFGKANVQINYTIPKFRDYKVGRFIFEENSNFLHQNGVNEIFYNQALEPTHIDFLKVMGFETLTINQEICYSKKI